MHLVEHLVKENASVYITDISDEKVKGLAQKFGVKGVGMDEIYDLDMDIYAPCALGATLNDTTIPRLKCRVIAGAANNQLKDEMKHGYMLIDRGITYAPDFLINAGGLINVYNEYLGNYNRARVFAQAEGIYNTCLNIFAVAEAEKINNQEAAIKLAERRIEEVGRVRVPR